MFPIYRLVSVLLLFGVGAEFFLAGAGAFGATSFDSHKMLGFALLAGGALTLLLAIAARRNVRIALAATVVIAVQAGLGAAGSSHPWIGAIHGLLAAAVAGIVSVNARRAMRPQGVR